MAPEKSDTFDYKDKKGQKKRREKIWFDDIKVFRDKNFFLVFF